MTITTRWCPECEEICTDHSTICTTCGTRLLDTSQALSSIIRLLDSQVRELRDDVERLLGVRGQEMSTRLSILHSQVREARASVQQTLEEQQGVITSQQMDIFHSQARRIWYSLQRARNAPVERRRQVLPMEAMDPQQGASRTRPTSKAFLEKLPRTTLGPSSSLFYEASLVADDTQEISALLGDFGPTCPSTQGQLVVADPLTGKNGLSKTTRDDIQANKSIVYMERGDGVTFVQKALLAQDAGAVALVIGNHCLTPWPYVMKDSKGEASSLTIPVVMVKQSHGQMLSKLHEKQCELSITQNTRDCVVCQDDFQEGQTVIQLSCGHVFHEACALQWLTCNNACPYCRLELPTDDAEYEQERRRTQRTHAGSTSTQSAQWNDMYG